MPRRGGPASGAAAGLAWATPMNPPGRVVVRRRLAAVVDAEGATTPESLRRPDRAGEATLESSTAPSGGGLADGESSGNRAG